MSTRLLRMIWALVFVLILAGAGMSTVAMGLGQLDPPICEKVGLTCGRIEDCGGLTAPCYCDLSGKCQQLIDD